MFEYVGDIKCKNSNKKYEKRTIFVEIFQKTK